MNSQISFSNEEKKESLSTPKFPMNKSFNSLERKKNILDTLKQNIKAIMDLEIETINNGNSNEENNNEYLNDNIDNNFVLCSLINKNNNKNKLNNSIQFSFDGKSKNYIITKNEKEDNKENFENNIIFIDNTGAEDNISGVNNELENIKDINNKESYLNNSNKKNNNESIDNNFNYILPLESDKSSEHFNLVSFQGYSVQIEDKSLINFHKIPNQKKMTGERQAYNNPEILNKKTGIGCLSKQIKNRKKVIIKENLNLTPHKKNKNKMSKINKPFNYENFKNKISKSIHNSSKKKRNYNLRIPSLFDEFTIDKCFTEPNNLYIESKKKNDSQSQKNTYYTSKGKNSILSPKKGIIIKNITRPFIIEKININKNNNYIIQNVQKKSNIIKSKKNPKNRNSINYMKRNKFNEENKNEIIYEKNLNSLENRSFSINKKDKINLIHSRNYSQITNNNLTYENMILNNKIKNCVILLSQKNIKNSAFQTRQNSFGNFSISSSESSAQKTIKKIKKGKKICSPFSKSKIIKKKSFKERYIFNNEPSSINKIIKINNSEKYEDNHTFISSNEKNNNKFTIYCNYDSKKKKNSNKSNNKETIKKSEINKIKVNTSNNNLNYYPIKYYHKDNTCFINYKNNNSNFILEDKKGNITERPANIYSKKVIFINNSNNNLFSSINNESNSYYKKKNKIDKKKINKSLILNKEKNIFVNENNNNNSTLIKEKNKIKFHEYFNDILSNIDLNKNININKKNTINNFKKIRTRNQNINNAITSNINTTEKNILSNYKINSFKPKFKYKNKITKKSEKISQLYNNINNNSIFLGYNNNFGKNSKIPKKKEKISFTRENSLNIPKFKKNIMEYTILRNNQNNKISSEVSIYIGKENTNNSKGIYIGINNNNEYKIQKEKYNNNKKLKAINVNKKTIINVNQFYPSYIINNNNENTIKNKNTSYLN